MWLRDPTIATNNDQDHILIPDIVQEATQDLDNVMVPPINVQEAVLEEKTLQPQEPMQLRNPLERGEMRLRIITL